MLIVDAPLKHLIQETGQDLSATETDVLNLLKRYSVSSSLLEFGNLSRVIFANKSLPGRINSDTQVTITTYGVSQATAVANIKNILNQDRGVFFLLHCQILPVGIIL